MEVAGPLKETSWNNMENKDIPLSSSSCLILLFHLKLTLSKSDIFCPGLRLPTTFDGQLGLESWFDFEKRWHTPAFCLSLVSHKGIRHDFAVKPRCCWYDPIYETKRTGLKVVGVFVVTDGRRQLISVQLHLQICFAFTQALRRLCISQEGHEDKMILNMWNKMQLQLLDLET